MTAQQVEAPDPEARCVVTELLITSCSHCKASGGPFWAARYEGVCRAEGCSDLIEVGQRVKWNQEGTGVIHARHKQ